MESDSEDDEPAAEPVIKKPDHSKKRKAGISASALTKVESSIKENSLGLLVDFRTQEIIVPMIQVETNYIGKVQQKTVQELQVSSTPAIYFPTKKTSNSLKTTNHAHHQQTIDYSRFFKRIFTR